MKELQVLIKKAQTSSFYLWLLNFILGRMVPFNKPHHIKIRKITDTEITVHIPNRRFNHNHIKGIHACALATVCEYVSGLSLMLHISAKEYRIILKNIHMTYHYQAKCDVLSTFKMTPQWVEQEVIRPLKNQESIFRELKVEVYDLENNHICTGLINWQIKRWDKVRLKVD